MLGLINSGREIILKNVVIAFRLKFWTISYFKVIQMKFNIIISQFVSFRFFIKLI